MAASPRPSELPNLVVPPRLSTAEARYIVPQNGTIAQCVGCVPGAPPGVLERLNGGRQWTLTEVFFATAALGYVAIAGVYLLAAIGTAVRAWRRR